MYKIVIEIGLLIFFLSIIIFMQQGILLETVLFRSLVIFIVVTVMMSLLMITFIKAINKSFLKKEKLSNQN
ncbi:MAG: hypothetical protein NTX22_11000 [Ignavibacteriales bacterium]|nr:hypothetical protein [Ignavibacteriales bacterium]